MKTIITAFLGLLLIASCSRPEPTSRSFSRTEVVGTWTHNDSHPLTQNSTGSYMVTLTLLDNGTFEQTIVAAGQSGSSDTTGTWTLSGSRINFEGLLTDDWDEANNQAKWKKNDAEWWFVDWHDSKQKVALFGALHPDPDAYAPWTKQR